VDIIAYQDEVGVRKSRVVGTRRYSVRGLTPARTRATSFGVLLPLAVGCRLCCRRLAGPQG
jgi:hypothetical protein